MHGIGTGGDEIEFQAEAARPLADQPFGFPGDGPVGEDDEAEGLAVRPARGPCRREEDVTQGLLGDPLIGVAPDGPRRFPRR